MAGKMKVLLVGKTKGAARVWAKFWYQSFFRDAPIVNNQDRLETEFIEVIFGSLQSIRTTVIGMAVDKLMVDASVTPEQVWELQLCVRNPEDIVVVSSMSDHIKQKIESP